MYNILFFIYSLGGEKIKLFKRYALLIPKEFMNFDLQNGVLAHSAVIQGIMALLFEFPSDHSQVVVIKLSGIQNILVFLYK